MIINKPFRFWCQKVLPLVYDDSLSYYELLCKVVDFLNKLLEGEGELASAFNELKEYVDNYFNSTDFYQIVDDKLDEMAEDGTLADLINQVILGSKISYCPTVADLPTTDLILGNIYQTGGYTTVGDGGGLLYVIGDSDGGHGILLADGYYANPVFLSPYVTPEMFGAVGDGNTDDSASVQAAINSEVGTVLLLNTYRLEAQITAASNRKIIGTPDSKLLWGNVNNVTSLLFGSNLSNIEFENVSFDFGTQSDLKYGVSLLTCENIKFVGCSVKNGYGYAFRLNASTGIIIKDCSFEDIPGAATNPGGAIYGQDMKDVTISGCKCENLGDHFFYSAGVNGCENIVISDCILKTSGTNGLTGGSAITLYANSHDISIVNCVFEECREGIYAGPYSEYLTLPKNVTVSNCVFKNITTNAMTIYGISNANRVRRISVNNCQVNGAGQDGICIRHGEYLQMNNISFDSVVRSNMEISDTYASMFAEIQMTEVKNTGVIVSNSTYGASDYNIFRDFYIAPSALAISAAVGFYLRQGNYNLLNNIRADSFPANDYVRGGAYNSWFNSNAPAVNKSMFFTTDITEVVYHNVGDVVFNSQPSTGNPALWVCTVAGSPGTLVPVATLS